MAANRKHLLDLAEDAALSKPPVGVPRQIQFRGNKLVFLANNDTNSNIYFANFPAEGTLIMPK